ncbi:D-alanine/D-alanine ligase [Desulfatibacillum aliphaticivorans]|uniref:D-alanine--D-alanine ligase n=1 Tax=Desulfatibacillum aliphaticivorans TaxID=218208 RepID=B8FGM5_DESAL|nr:D-alanine--D-alanine ligase [Desulfatibacillum aliphaticivorans]ACL04934.1 D-alanine/D-alanine ligase [Desulfatibacillum aliphaticivorans]
MKRLNLALLFGGASAEREVSILSGTQVLNALDKDRFIVRCYDPKIDIPRLVHDAPNIDVAVVMLHGEYGEDGRIQGLLDMLDIPYQGSGVLGSAVSMSKLASKQLYEQAGIKTPPYRVVSPDNRHEAANLADQVGYPLFVKPCMGGSSIGMSLVKGPADLDKALDAGFAEDPVLLLEACVTGVEITGAVLGNDELEALPLIEIVPGEEFAFFEYGAKYEAGKSEEICPARISEEGAQKAMDLSKQAHKALFCKGYSRTDMILDKDGALHVLETNTIPGMTANSLLPKAAKVAGMDFTALMSRLVDLALEAKGRPGHIETA